MEGLKRCKADLKELAGRIRNGKSGRKPRFRDDSNREDFGRLETNRFIYRHKHIAYCQLRGRERSEIECPASPHKARESAIDAYMEEYRDGNDVCLGAE